MTAVTVMCWNMAMGYGSGCSWNRLEELMRRHQDVALLNGVSTEVLRGVPGALFEPWGTRGRDRKRRNWGTAVVSRHPMTEIRDAQAMSYDGRKPNVRFGNSRPGSWVAGLVDLPNGGPVTSVSVYGQGVAFHPFVPPPSAVPGRWRRATMAASDSPRTGQHGGSEHT